MARVYGFLQPDGSLLMARRQGDSWAVTSQQKGVEGRGSNVVVFINGLDVLGLSATIPARNEKEALKAAPFAVEDDLADNIENSHVALAELDKSVTTLQRQINVIAKTTLAQIIDLLVERGLDEAELVAAHSILPPGNVLYEAPGLILGRLGGRSFALDPTLGRDVLVRLADPFEDILIHGDQLGRALGQTAVTEGAQTLPALLSQLATWADAGQPYIGLRKGGFEAVQPLDLEAIGRWKFAGAIAAVTAIGWFGSMVLETNAMNARAEALNALAGEFAQAGWPELSGDVNEILSLSRSSTSDITQPFLGLLDATAILYDALGQVEGSELRTLRYDRARRQMTASVACESFADLDRVTGILNATTGLSARSGDARQSGEKVIGDLTLESAS
ncbi:MAG: type II secretion system protein GspL [Pseudomonadota bacterium]